MFDVLVYLYETYYRPDACPEPEALVKKLSAVGFEDEEISEALGWLTDLAETTHEFSDRYPQQVALSFGTRIFLFQFRQSVKFPARFLPPYFHLPASLQLIKSTPTCGFRRNPLIIGP